VSSRRNRDIGSNLHIVPIADIPIINQHQVEIGVEALPDMDMLSIGHVHGRFYPNGAPATAQQLLQQIPSFRTFTWPGEIVVIDQLFAPLPLFIKPFPNICIEVAPFIFSRMVIFSVLLVLLVLTSSAFLAVRVRAQKGCDGES
jgi:hypothetical protein